MGSRVWFRDWSRGAHEAFRTTQARGNSPRSLRRAGSSPDAKFGQGHETWGYRRPGSVWSYRGRWKRMKTKSEIEQCETKANPITTSLT